MTDNANDDAPRIATYLWPDNLPMPDGIMLKDASSACNGRSARMESYGRNTLHYSQMREAEERIAALEREIELLKEE